MIYAIFSILDLLLQIIVYLIIGQVILSWLVAFNVINTQSAFVRTVLDTLDRLTGPIFRPIRRLLPDFGGIDFSPIVVLLAIQLIRKLLVGLSLELGPTIT